MPKSVTTLVKDARLIVEKCMAVTAGDKVLIIADHGHMAEARALAGCCHAVGGLPVIADITPHVTAGLISMKAPVEPPEHLAAAMLSADVILITTNLEWANRFAHVNPVKASVERGVRIASVEEGMGAWDLAAEDIDDIVGQSERIIEYMKGAREVRVTSDLGTDVKICVEGRPALKVVPVKGKGEMMGPVPLWGEVAYAAVEDKTEGIIVVDGIMLGVGVPGSLKNHITIEVKNGRAVDIRGGEEAERLKKVISEADENANVIGEFAIGTSEKEVPGSPSEKGLRGTVHFALGDNWHCYPGGQNVSRIHLDGSVRNVTITVDGKVMVEKGRLII